MGTHSCNILYAPGIQIRAREIPIGNVEGIEYIVAAVDTEEVEGAVPVELSNDYPLDCNNTIFDKAPFAAGEINTLLDAMLEAVKQDHFY